jgi:hypothetical protein
VHFSCILVGNQILVIGKPSASPNFGVLSRSYLGQPLILQQVEKRNYFLFIKLDKPNLVLQLQFESKFLQQGIYSSSIWRWSLYNHVLSLHTSRSARRHGLALPASRLARFSLRDRRETERTKNQAAAAAVKERNSIGCRPPLIPAV